MQQPMSTTPPPPPRVIIVLPLSQQPPPADPQNEVIAQRYFTSEYPVEKVWSLFSKSAPFREYAFFIPTNTTQPQSASAAPSAIETCAVRHLHFLTAKDMANAIAHYRPVRIEVGGVYLTDSCTTELLLSHETVFDIDIDAYDKPPRARSCNCSKSQFCRSCWKLVAVAGKMIVHRMCARGIPKADILVHYSGGRGIHVRVHTSSPTFNSADRSVREAVRGCIVGNLPLPMTPSIVEDHLEADPDMWQALTDVLLNQSDMPSGFLGWYIDEHPLAALEALVISTSAVSTRLAGEKRTSQQASALSNSSEAANFIALLGKAKVAVDGIAPALLALQSDPKAATGSTGVRALAATSPMKYRGVIATLDLLVRAATNAVRKNASPYANATGVPWNHTLTSAIYVAAMLCMWPRVDKGPSDQPTHLLRAPYGVHLSTMRVGVSINLDDLMAFYPRDSAPEVTMKGGGALVINL